LIATSALAAIGAMPASLRPSIALAIAGFRADVAGGHNKLLASICHRSRAAAVRRIWEAGAGAGGQNGRMLIVRATRKLLGRLGPITAEAGQRSTTLLGDWYATAWFWRPQVALLVSETTLLPVLMPLAPAATFLQRFGPQLAAVLAAHRTPAEFIDAELREMDQVRLARTASRSVVGIMNEFTYLADACRHDEPDLLKLAVRLAATPCGPLYKRHISPDRDLAALVAARTRPPR